MRLNGLVKNSPRLPISWLKRCISRPPKTGNKQELNPPSRPPMLPVLYNNHYQFVQSEGYVFILVEMNHNVRTVRLGGEPLPVTAIDETARENSHRLPRFLPDGEHFLYLGDTARLPYGTKSPATVQRYALNAEAHLLRHGIKLLVVACNTASSYALDELSDASPVPVVGVVEPGVRAALASGARRIGIIGTEGTIRSLAYQQALAALGPGIEVEATSCPLFVPLAEEGWADTRATTAAVEDYLEPLFARTDAPDTLVLGCTHFPVLAAAIQRHVGEAITLVDSAETTAAAPKPPGSAP